MPLNDPNDPIDLTFRITLEVDDAQIATFQKVEGLTMEQDVVETKQTAADGSFVIRKLPGRWKGGEVTLTRGLTSDQSVSKWLMSTAVATTFRPHQMTLVLFASDGTPVARYHLENAWPSKLEIGSLDAGASSLMTEKLVLVYESFEVE